MVLRRDQPYAQVVVPDHRELDRGTLRAILRGAGVAVEEVGIATSVRELRSAGLKDAHHIIQDAAVRDLPGYISKDAPGVHLPGPSSNVGTPHFRATEVQRQAGGGTYGAERRIAYKALRSAGFSPTEARAAIARSDTYFGGLGVSRSTPTRTPGNRP